MCSSCDEYPVDPAGDAPGSQSVRYLTASTFRYLRHLSLEIGTYPHADTDLAGAAAQNCLTRAQLRFHNTSNTRKVGRYVGTVAAQSQWMESDRL